MSSNEVALQDTAQSGQFRDRPETTRTSGRGSTSEVTEHEVCPECQGAFVTEGGETYCDSCGFVEVETQIDHGPEWRGVDTSSQSASNVRAEGALDVTLHDWGLSTNIGHKRDSYGNKLNAKTRRKMNRLRTLHSQARTQDSKQRTARSGLTEIRRMASALGLGKPVMEVASVIYRKASNEDLLKGRCLESVAGASLYLAARINNTPRTYDEMEAVSRVAIKRVKQAQQGLQTNLDIEVEPTRPHEYLVPFAENIGFDADDTHLKEKVIEEARRLLDEAGEEQTCGRAPTSVAASALYAACLSLGYVITQARVAETCPPSPPTLRSNYPFLIGNDPENDLSTAEAESMRTLDIVKELNDNYTLARYT